MNEDHLEEGCSTAVGAMAELYTLRPSSTLNDAEASREMEGGDTQDSLCVNTNWLHSTKGYTNVGHMNCQDRHDLPLTKQLAFGLNKWSFIKLQRLMSKLSRLAERALGICRSQGFAYRLEFSVRPGFDSVDERLRTKGHFVDFLTVVMLSVDDLLYHSDHKVRIHTLDHNLVYAKFCRLANLVGGYLRHSASAKFFQVYHGKKMADWLRAHVSMCMVLIGLAGTQNLCFVKSWLRDQNRFDPFSQAEALLGDFLKHRLPAPPRPTLKPEVPAAVLEEVEHSQLSHDGKGHLISILRDLLPGHIHLSLLTKFTFQDKFELIRFVEGASQRLASSLAQEALNNEQDDEVDFQCDNDFVPGVHQAQVISEHEAPAVEPEESEALLHCTSPSYLPVSHEPLRKLAALVKPFSPVEDPGVFARRLCFHVNCCHDNQLVLHGRQLQPLPANARGLIERLESRHEQVGSVAGDLIKTLWSELASPETPKPQDQALGGLLSSLSAMYAYPCVGVSPCHRRDLREGSTLLGASVDAALLMDIVTPLPSRRPGKLTFFRHANQTEVSIAAPLTVLVRAQPQFTCFERQSPNLLSLLSVAFLAPALEDSDQQARPLQDILRQRLSSFFEHLCLKTALSLKFLTEKGHISDQFSKVSCIDELQTKHGFALMPGQVFIFGEIPQDVLLPLVALRFQCSIMLHDEDAGATQFYLYDPSLDSVVTYRNETLLVTPKVSSLMLRHSSGRWTQRDLAQNPQGSLSCRVYELLSSTPTSCLDRIGNYAKHTQELKKTGSLLHSVDNVVQTRFQGQLDKLDCNRLESFCKELDQKLASGAARRLYFSQSLLNLQASTGSQVEGTLAEAVRNGMDKHCIVCPVVCLMHKVLLAIWEETPTDSRRTFVYTYSPEDDQVKVTTHQGFVYYKTLTDMLYVKVREWCSKGRTQRSHGSFQPAPSDSFLHFHLSHSLMPPCHFQSFINLLKPAFPHDLSKIDVHHLCHPQEPGRRVFHRVFVKIQCGNYSVPGLIVVEPPEGSLPPHVTLLVSTLATPSDATLAMALFIEPALSELERPEIHYEIREERFAHPPGVSSDFMFVFFLCASLFFGGRHLLEYCHKSVQTDGPIRTAEWLHNVLSGGRECLSSRPPPLLGATVACGGDTVEGCHKWWHDCFNDTADASPLQVMEER